ncbi:hypothetical protein DFJ73DRAFT_945783, partial [Zopfochytrium polystomum]
FFFRLFSFKELHIGSCSYSQGGLAFLTPCASSLSLSLRPPPSPENTQQTIMARGGGVGGHIVSSSSSPGWPSDGRIKENHRTAYRAGDGDQGDDDDDCDDVVAAATHNIGGVSRADIAAAATAAAAFPHPSVRRRMDDLSRLLAPDAAAVAGAALWDGSSAPVIATAATAAAAAGVVTAEALLDTLYALALDCKATANQSEYVAAFLRKFCSPEVKYFSRAAPPPPQDEAFVNNLQSLRVNTQDFEVVKTLATGAVGKVCLVRGKPDRQVYAMKILKKIDLLTRREASLEEANAVPPPLAVLPFPPPHSRTALHLTLKYYRQAAFFMEERNALVFAKQSDWITTLYAAFQDDEHLYLVMEYAPGGSLRSLINNRESPMTEAEARFYVAEMVLALEELHRYNYIHRDVKPENCLIVSSGHLKLADFGSCIRMGESNKVSSHETVGTPDYISPEILRANEGRTNYGKEVDWSEQRFLLLISFLVISMGAGWNKVKQGWFANVLAGVILYELLFDEVPFYSESLMETYAKIMDHERSFAFPDDLDITISSEAKDLIKRLVFRDQIVQNCYSSKRVRRFRLVCTAESRLGRGDVEEIKQHPWFKGFEWENIASGKIRARCGGFFPPSSPTNAAAPLPATPPFVPELSGPDDTRYFEDEDNESKKVARRPMPKNKEFMGQNLPFIGYTYVHNGSPALLFPHHHQNLPPLPNQHSQTPTVATPAPRRESETSEGRRQREKLEQHLAQARERAAASASEAQELRGKLAQSEAGRVRAEGEAERQREAARRAAAEREEAEGRVAAVRRRGEDEARGRARAAAAAAEEEAGRLRAVVDALREELAAEKQAARQRDASVAAAGEAWAELEKEVQRLQAVVKAERREKEDVADTVAELRRKNEKASEELREARADRDELEGKCDGLVSEVSFVRRQISEERAKLDQLETSYSQIEREKALIDVDLRSARRQLEELAEEKQALAALVRSKCAVDAKESEQLQLRERDSAELDALKKEKVLLELTVSDLNSKLKALVAKDTEAADSIAALSSRLSQQSATVKDLEGSVAHLKSTLSNRDTELQDLRKIQAKTQDEMKRHEERASTLTKQNEALAVQVSELTAQVNHEKELGVEASRKLTSLEQSQADAMRNRHDETAEREELSASLRDAAHQVERLRSRAADLETELARTTVDYELAFAKLRQEKAELAQEAQQAVRAKEGVEMELAAEADKVEELLERASRYEDAISRAEDRVRQMEARLLEAQTHHSLEAARSRALEDQLETLRLTVEDQVAKLRALEIHSVKGETVSLSSDGKSDRLKTALTKHKYAFFRTQQQRADQEKAMQRLQEAEEDMKISSEHEHVRRLHHSKVFEFDSSIPLKGLLSLPKGGKVKKGWKPHFAIVRDWKIIVFDKEKDIETSEGTVFADLRSDLFVVKSVSQNELIHASAREIDSIFKVRCAAKVASSPATTMSRGDLSRRKITLEREIALEQKLKQAAERMLAISGDAQRTVIVSQIEASLKKLEKWGDEVARIEKQLASLEEVRVVCARVVTTFSNSRDRPTCLLLLPTVPPHHSQTQQTCTAPQTQTTDKPTQELSQDFLDEEIARFKTVLQAQLQEETRKQQNLLKLSGPDRKFKDSKHGRDVEVELHAIANQISKLEGDLETLQSGDVERVSVLLRRLGERTSNGHNFQVIEQSCDDVKALSNAKALYFMAPSPQEKQRWLAGLEHYRKEALSSHQGGSHTHPHHHHHHHHHHHTLTSASLPSISAAAAAAGSNSTPPLSPAAAAAAAAAAAGATYAALPPPSPMTASMPSLSPRRVGGGGGLGGEEAAAASGLCAGAVAGRRGCELPADSKMGLGAEDEYVAPPAVAAAAAVRRKPSLFRSGTLRFQKAGAGGE